MWQLVSQTANWKPLCVTERILLLLHTMNNAMQMSTNYYESVCHLITAWSYKKKQSKCKYKTLFLLDKLPLVSNNHLTTTTWTTWTTWTYKNWQVFEVKFSWVNVASDRWNSRGFNWLEMKIPWILPTSLMGEPDSCPAARINTLNKLQ